MRTRRRTRKRRERMELSPELVEEAKEETNEEVTENVTWMKHYSSLHEILLVGEGDFSFSLSLANAFGSASNIVATSLDSHGHPTFFSLIFFFFFPLYMHV